MRAPRSFRPRPVPTTLAVAAASLGIVACGLSLAIDGVGPEPATPDAARDGATAASDGGPPIATDGAVVVDAQSDTSVEIDAGCTTIVKEDFSGDGGSLVQSLPDAGVDAGDAEAGVGGEAGALTLVPRGLFSSAGAAYTNLPEVTGFEVSFTFTTEALGNITSTADGFAVSWLELPLPANPTFRDGPNFGMTDDPQGQHGRGFYANLFANPRSIVENEVRFNDSTNSVGQPLGTLTTTGPLRFVGKIVRRRGQYTYDFATPGQDVLGAGSGPTSRITRTRTDAEPTKKYQAFVFSAGSGGRMSPGFHVDDIEIKACDP